MTKIRSQQDRESVFFKEITDILDNYHDCDNCGGPLLDSDIINKTKCPHKGTLEFEKYIKTYGVPNWEGKHFKIKKAKNQEHSYVDYYNYEGHYWVHTHDITREDLPYGRLYQNTVTNEYLSTVYTYTPNTTLCEMIDVCITVAFFENIVLTYIGCWDEITYKEACNHAKQKT